MLQQHKVRKFRKNTLTDFLGFRLEFLSKKDQNEKFFKGLLPGLRQYLTCESPLKMMKIFFYFTLRVLFVL